MHANAIVTYSTRDLRGRSFVITGANTGIGSATAEALGARGADLVLACRSEARARPVLDRLERAGRVSFVPLDLGDLASVRRCAELLAATRIDVLINNAGVGGTRGVTKDGFELAFGVNYLGHYLLTRLLLARMRNARIVHVVSGSHRNAQRLDFETFRGRTRSLVGLPEYAASKLCNVLFHHELARRLGGRVTTHAVDPGNVASDGWRHVPWPIRPLMKISMKSNEEGARTSVWCATSEQVATGKHYVDCTEQDASPLSHDRALARELWQRSADWVGLAPD